METDRISWKREAWRVVPLVVLSFVGWISPTISRGLTGAAILNSAALVVAVAAAVLWRRRHPVVVTVVVAVAMVFLPGLGMVTYWLYLSLAIRSRPPAIVATGVLVALTTAVMTLISPETGDFSFAGEEIGVVIGAFVMGFLFAAAVGAFGAYLGSSRREKAAVAERLAAAERAQELAQENARVEERSRIAREMHDVLAHKITLISLHAGALEYRDDLAPDEVRAAGATIRQSSHDALVELRGILGQLRQTDDATGAPSKPQPGLAALDELVAEHRRAGRSVDVERRLAADPPETVGRHAYRVAVEGLTNAARHAPGTAVRLELDGDEDAGLTLRLTNRLSLSAPDSPGAGLGLVGLTERVEFVGGRLTAGERDGEFVVEAWLPWQ
ncbi:MAG: histidine kinase [Propionibacterium sp.]|nr:histidine kinase [Propionibacterium sp.]